MKAFTVGQKVQDRWWLDWGLGTVTRVLKTRIWVSFAHGCLRYDKAHTQFLKMRDRP